MNGQKPRIVLHRASIATPRIERARAFLAACDKAAPCVCVFPSRASGIMLMSSLLEPGEACFAWQRHTVATLAQALARPAMLRAGVVTARGLSKLSLASRALDELRREGALGRFAPVAERPGLVRALLSTLDELRMARVSCEQLARVDPELARIAQRYERLLGELRLIDRSELLAYAERALPHVKMAPLLWFDVAVTNVAEVQFLRALLARSSSALLTLPEHEAETLEAQLGLDDDVAREIAPLNERCALNRVAARLFRSDESADVAQAADDTSKLELFTSPGESREAVEVVRRVLEAAERGVPFDRMAIALRSPESYRSAFEEALSRAKVPAFFAEGVKRPNLAGRALLVLLECAREGLSARGFAEYLSLGVVPSAEQKPRAEVLPRDEEDLVEPLHVPAPEADATPPTPRRWERLIVDAAVIGGRERWRRRLQSLMNAMRSEAALSEVEEPHRARLLRDATQLEALQRFALPLLDALSALPNGGTWGAWISALDALVALAIRNGDELRATLAELWPLAAVGPVSVDDVLRLLTQRIADQLLPAQGSFAGKVLVAGVDELRGRSFEIVFVPGLAEKIFPPRLFEDALLPDRVRVALGAQLPCVSDRVALERGRLRIALGAASQAVVISYPRFDVEHGRPRVPSFYGLEILRALDGKTPSFDAFRRRAKEGAAPRMGYPAPLDPQQAIDDAELDLAMLARLFEAKTAHKKGAARYLLDAHPVLARALRFRARRYSLSRFCHADGFVAESDEVRALLTPYRLAVRPISATTLASFARCPYQFYLRFVLGLAPRATIEETDELDARQRGIIFHAVQRATLERCKAENLLPLSEMRLGRACEIASRELAQAALQTKDDTPPAIEHVLDDMLRTIEADLREWLSRMVADDAWLPSAFELGFGLSRSHERDRTSDREPVLLPQGVLLRGAIDLVETRQAADGVTALRATDHKTGEANGPLNGVVRGGEMLQPVLYALALEQIFPGQQVAGGRLYFCTSKGGFVEHSVPLHSGARSMARELVQVIDGSLAHGFLPAAPKEDACEVCEYRAICGPYERERVAKKKQEPLEPLFRLRNLP